MNPAAVLLSASLRRTLHLPILYSAMSKYQESIVQAINGK